MASTTSLATSPGIGGPHNLNFNLGFGEAKQLPNFDPRMSIGTTGLKEHSGVIDEEFLVRLRGMNGVRFYREMGDNSAILAAAMNVIKMLVRQVEWRVEAADDSDAARAEADFIDSAILDMSMTLEDFMSEVLSFLQFGWSYFETIYKLRRGDSPDPTLNSLHNDGKWGWRKFEIRAQETLSRWVFDEDGGILGMVQLDPHKGRGPVFINMEKALLFRTETTKGNPEGRALFRPAVTSYWNCKRIQEFEVIGVERDLAGMPIMEVPFEMLIPDAPEDLLALKGDLERFVTQVRRDERWGGLVPSEVKPDGTQSGFKFKLMTTGGRRQINTNEIVQRYESRQLMLFLAQFLILGQDKVGTQSLASSMTDLFSVAIGTFMDIIATTFNRFGVRRLQKLNNRPVELDPKLVHGDIETPDLEELGKYIVNLSQSGVSLAHRKIERKLIEVADLPVPTDEEMDEADLLQSSTGPTKLPDDDPDLDNPTGNPAGDSTSEAAPVAQPSETLNQGQIKALMEIVQEVARDNLSTEVAIEILTISFPISAERAARLLAAAEKMESKPKPIPPGLPGGGGPVPPPAVPDNEDDPDA